MFTVADARRCALKLFTQSAHLKTLSRSSLLLDADVLLQYILHKPRSWLFAHDNADISTVKEAFYTAAAQRALGLPIAYITGKKDFWTLSFSVSPAVLIPKPDTELLVERSLAVLREKVRKKALLPAPVAQQSPIYFLDPCTGSGCVAVSLLHTLEEEGIHNIYGIALDISREALEIARCNAKRLLSEEAQKRLYIGEGDMHKLPKVLACLLPLQAGSVFSEQHSQPCAQHPELYDEQSVFLPDMVEHLPCCTEWLYTEQQRIHEHLRLTFDLIAANPPYVPSALVKELLSDGRSEPERALDGGRDGLDFIRSLTNNAGTILNDAGVLLSEVGEYHADSARRIFEQAGFADIHIHKDWTHRDRLIEGHLGVS